MDPFSEFNRLSIIKPRGKSDTNYESRVHIASDDEFATLAESHNRMAQAVQTRVRELQIALEEVRELQGLLPICAACKSIRDSDGYFKTVETYLVGKSKLEFSHTICTDCVPRLYPELSDQILKAKQAGV